MLNTEGRDVELDFSHVLSVLEELRRRLLAGRYDGLVSLSDETTADAALDQHPMHIVVAVFVYAISKVYAREYYREMPEWNSFEEALMGALESMIEATHRKHSDDVILYAGELRNVLNRFSGNLGIYIKDIFRKAEINKAFVLYEHGLSASQSAELLGVSLWELAGYFGISRVGEAKISQRLDVEKRINYVEEFFA